MKTTNIACNYLLTLTLIALNQGFSSAIQWQWFLKDKLSNTSSKASTKVTKEEALEDIKYLKTLFEQFYGPYSYLSPDLNWHKIFVKLDLIAYHFSSTKEILWEDFWVHIKESLESIPDGHIRIAKKSTLSKIKYYSTYKTKTNLILPVPNCHSVKITNQIVESLCKWLIQKTSRTPLPYLKLDTLSLENQILFKKQLRKIPKNQSFILDLRNNNGGDPTKAVKTIYTYMGYSFNFTKIIQRHSKIDYLKRMEKSPDDNTLKFILTKNIKIEGTKKIPILPNDITTSKESHEKTVYILQNNRCASGCELIIYLMKHYPNTIFLGQNTNGSLLTWNNKVFTLPNSRINITLGSAYLEDYSKLENFGFEEGVGFYPDVQIPFN